MGSAGPGHGGSSVGTQQAQGPGPVAGQGKSRWCLEALWGVHTALGLFGCCSVCEELLEVREQFRDLWFLCWIVFILNV